MKRDSTTHKLINSSTHILVFLLVILLAGCTLFFKKDILPQPDEIHRAMTSDGWEIALYHYKAPKEIPGREPVLLCHGLQANRLNMDFSAQVSLARHLQRQGFDTWIMEVRGGGNSSKAGFLGFGKYGYNYNFDDYVMKDLPAAINYVKKATGAQKLLWVGHSNGGMVILAYMAYFGDADIKGAVTVASPVDFAWMTDAMKANAGLKPLLKLTSYYPLGTITILLNPLLSDPYTANNFGNGFANIESLGREEMMVMTRNGIFNVSNAVMLQFADWVESGDR
jgi:pimeloyl-ACP methyl ester carboxylesterase